MKNSCLKRSFVLHLSCAAAGSQHVWIWDCAEGQDQYKGVNVWCMCGWWEAAWQRPVVLIPLSLPPSLPLSQVTGGQLSQQGWPYFPRRHQDRRWKDDDQPSKWSQFHFSRWGQTGTTVDECVLTSAQNGTHNLSTGWTNYSSWIRFYNSRTGLKC